MGHINVFFNEIDHFKQPGRPLLGGHAYDHSFAPLVWAGFCGGTDCYSDGIQLNFIKTFPDYPPHRTYSVRIEYYYPFCGCDVHTRRPASAEANTASAGNT